MSIFVSSCRKAPKSIQKVVGCTHAIHVTAPVGVSYQASSYYSLQSSPMGKIDGYFTHLVQYAQLILIAYGDETSDCHQLDTCSMTQVNVIFSNKVL